MAWDKIGPVERRARFFRSCPMPYLQSSALLAVSYDETRHALRATFRDSGRTYIYDGVPQELYDALLFADSVGAFFNTHIRDRFTFREA
jgi:hypothetical protein